MERLHSFDDPLLTELFQRVSQGEKASEEAHRMMSSYSRPSVEEARKAKRRVREGAVLILIYPKTGSGLHTVLIERPETGSVHSGQMAFPGGGREEYDNDLKETALREAWEELGIEMAGTRVHGSLSEIYIPPSEHLVTPFLASFSEKPDFRPCPDEVASYEEIPLSFFIREDAISERKVRAGKNGVVMKVPAFVHKKRVIWGATALMLAELRSMILRIEERQ